MNIPRKVTAESEDPCPASTSCLRGHPPARTAANPTTYIPSIFHKCCAWATGCPSKESLNPPVAILKSSITTKNAPIIVIKSKFFIKITSRKLPAKQVRHFCETAPNTSPPTSAMRTGACILPGPFSLTAIRVVITLKSSTITKRAGRTYPLTLLDS